MKAYQLFVLAAIILFSSCTQDKMPTLIELDMELRRLVSEASPTNDINYYILSESNEYDKLPQDPSNPLTQEKVELGKLLFYETGLAQDALRPESIGTYSCATCHVPEAGFKAGNFQGIADGGVGYGIDGKTRLRNLNYDESEIDVQAARPLSMVNVGYVHNTSWNGSFGSTHVNEGTEDVWDQDQALARNHMGMQGLETQNIDGIEVHRLTYTEDVLTELGYKELFDIAFADIPKEERYSTFTGSLALSAYLRTIVSTKAPFQYWLKGNYDALPYEQKEGAILFFGKAKCSNCHYKENLGSLEFHALGVKDMYQRASYTPDPLDKRNFGRGGFTLKEEDNYKFKVPGLYNSTDTDFYFHGASHSSIESLIEYKDKAISENPNVPQERLSEKFEPLGLTEKEKEYLKLFLEYGLRDPDLVRYKPSSVFSGNCIPNNDPQSRVDLGCQ